MLIVEYFPKICLEEVRKNKGVLGSNNGID